MKQPKQVDGKSHFGVRLPHALKRQVKKTAVAHDRTVEQFVEVALLREIARLNKRQGAEFIAELAGQA